MEKRVTGLKRIYASIPRLHIDHPAIFAPALVAISILVGVVVGRLTSPTPNADALHTHISIHLLAKNALRANLDCARAESFEEVVAARTTYNELLFIERLTDDNTFSQSVYESAVEQQSELDDVLNRSELACRERLIELAPKGLSKKEIFNLVSENMSPVLNPGAPDRSQFK